MKKPSKFVGTYVDESVYRSAKALAAKEQRSLSSMLRIFLAEGVQHHASRRRVCNTREVA